MNEIAKILTQAEDDGECLGLVMAYLWPQREIGMRPETVKELFEAIQQYRDGATP